MPSYQNPEKAYNYPELVLYPPLLSLRPLHRTLKFKKNEKDHFNYWCQ